jgi:esterase
MFMNEFATGTTPTDMTGSEEFASLLTSATELEIPHARAVRYASCHTVVRGQRFHFSEWGDPASPPILLLHGGNQSSHSWDLVSLHLADRYHVHALDQRGHGDSEWSREVDYSVDAMVADAAAFIADRGLDRPIVFGHSMGGRVTLSLALHRPEIARALIIVDVGPELSPEGTKAIMDFVVHNVEFEDLDVFVENVQRYDKFRTRAHIERTVKYNMLRRADGKYVSKVDHRRSPTTQAPLTLGEMETLDLPVLVVRGAESNVFAADAAERFVGALSQGSLVTVPNCGHNVHSGNTLGFLGAVNTFLSGLAH